MDNKYINLNRLEFFITDHCSCKCKHCSVMNKKELKTHIEKSTAVEIIKKVSKEYNLESIMTFGGEPLLFPEVVYAVHQAAADVGIPTRQIITNGYWSKDPEKIKEIASNLAAAGVNTILISVDAFHQEYIPLDIVKNAAKALLESGIEDLKWSPCWVVSEDDNNPYNNKTRSILKELEEIPIKTGYGNIVSPEGAALEHLNEYFPSKKNLSTGKCTDMPYTDPLDCINSLSIETNGDIAVCRGFTIGNAISTDIMKIIEDYNPYENQYMKVILEEGIEGLLKIADTKGIKVDTQGFHSICDMCKFIRQELSSI